MSDNRRNDDEAGTDVENTTENEAAAEINDAAIPEETHVEQGSSDDGFAAEDEDALASVGMFLAVLELVRCERVCFEQHDDGPIQLKLREPEIRSSSDDSIGGEASQQLS